SRRAGAERRLRRCSAGRMITDRRSGCRRRAGFRRSRSPHPRVEGFDAALRIGNLADSSMMAGRIGDVRPVVVAAPRYLKQNPRIAEPGDLAKRQIITMAHLSNSWTFPPVA